MISKVLRDRNEENTTSEAERTITAHANVRGGGSGPAMLPHVSNTEITECGT